MLGVPAPECITRRTAQLHAITAQLLVAVVLVAVLLVAVLLTQLTGPNAHGAVCAAGEVERYSAGCTAGSSHCVLRLRIQTRAGTEARGQRHGKGDGGKQ